MRSVIPRWFLFGLLIGWSLTQANVFGQSTGKSDPPVNKLKAGLDKQITVDFNDTSIVAVVKHIGEKAGLQIEIDPNLAMQIQGGINPPPFPGGEVAR